MEVFKGYIDSRILEHLDIESIQSARQWGNRLDIDEVDELFNDDDEGLLQRNPSLISKTDKGLKKSHPFMQFVCKNLRD